MTEREIPKSLLEALKTWLGEEGHAFFRGCLEEHGTVSPVFPTEGAPQIPHPVHFREGMQVRNFLRKRPECEGWTDHDFDDHWANIVRQVVR